MANYPTADPSFSNKSAGGQIQSAHIDNYGERAVDAFYVQTADGEKLSEPLRLAALRRTLAEALHEIAGLLGVEPGPSQVVRAVRELVDKQS